MRFLSFILSFSLIATGVLFVGCAKKTEIKANDAIAESKAFYKAHPEFFVFSSIDKLPADLKWQTGEGVEPFADTRAVKGGVLRDFVADFPRTLRVVGPDANGGFRGVLLDGNALGLLGFHPNTEAPYPSLASAWAVSDDKKTVYFRLDPAARFSDGQKITADNFFFSFYFFRSTHIHDPWYNNFYSTEYESITRYDNQTIAITLPRARPDFLEKAAGIRPLPMKFYSELGDDYTSRYQWRFEPTTGPYELRTADLQKGKRITMRRVKDWWANDHKFYRHRYNVDAMEFTVIRDVNKAFELFLGGQLDMFVLNLPEYWYDRAPQAPAVKSGAIQRAKFYNELPRPTWGFYLNTKDSLLSNIEVRKGIDSALNWDRVVAFFFRGDYDRMPTYGEGYGRFTNTTIKPTPFNIEAAQKHFAAAGFDKRGKDGVLTRQDGTRLSTTVTASEGPLTGLLTILKEEALKAGLELNLEILDGTTAFKKVSEKKHQIAFMAFNTSAERFPRYWEMFHGVNAKPQTNNLTNLTDPTIDTLIDKYDKAIDENEIEKLSWELQERIKDQAAYLPAFMKPWYRVGYWRWVRFPEGFDVRQSSSPVDWGLYWIDPAAQKETLEARDKGKTFDNTVETYDQWKKK